MGNRNLSSVSAIASAANTHIHNHGLMNLRTLTILGIASRKEFTINDLSGWLNHGRQATEKLVNRLEQRRLLRHTGLLHCGEGGPPQKLYGIDQEGTELLQFISQL